MRIFRHFACLFLFTFSSTAAEIDFSTCGYRQSDSAIPSIPVAAVVTPADRDDDRPAIQAAIDYVSGLEPGPDGFRGAVLLKGESFNLCGSLFIRTSGVVLRGSEKEKTVLRSRDVSRAPVIRIFGKPDRTLLDEWTMTGNDVPAGSDRIPLNHVRGLKAGMRVLITRPSTAEWIASIGMDREGIAWKPGTRDVRWERRIEEINGNTITLDAPVTTALEKEFGRARVAAFDWPGRISLVGVENLSLQSLSPGEDATGENRAWCGITMENASNAWVRQMRFSGFPGSAVALWESVQNVTVSDCVSLEPSGAGGGRRQSFFTAGQQTLFLRCWSEGGRHDFSAGHCAAGPNAFVQCQSISSSNFSGPLESWVSGLLFDNVTIDRAGLHLENRWSKNNGTGWTAANCTVWQSNAAEIRVFNPPGAENRAVGIWGTPSGDGHFSGQDEFASPRSLFVAQLKARLGSDEAVRHIGPVGRDYPAATNPTPGEVKAFIGMSSQPPATLKDTIDSARNREKPDVDIPSGAVWNPEPPQEPAPAFPRPIRIESGRLFAGDEPLTGKRYTPVWWRGNTRPEEAPAFGPAITRFVPGRIGRGFTDDLAEVAENMARSGIAVVEHHHGLWYDRRRDDHTRVQRADDAVVPPFYEQPFARSGKGAAADGLSRYDLTKYNSWYWHRLTEFATHCDQKGIVLLAQHYFQHNILEAGAHWTDFPWREANNINETGFPEPPPYISDKRIFQAHLFYDTSNVLRRPLHRAYIRRHLDAFAGHSNVVHSVGAEFTGPLEFVRFWIDTIIEWEKETENDATVCLSCTKDVQDAILTDPVRGPAVSIIDIRYWWYEPDGTLYAPPGGKNLAPRQHARQLKPERATSKGIKRAVEEYRERFPGKVVFVDGAPAA